MYIEPLFAPPLDGVGELDVEVLDIRANANDNAAYVVGDVVMAIAAAVKYALPQSPIGMDSKEALTESDENRDVEDGIGNQLVQLNPVNKEESPKELVNRHGKAAKEEIKENYLISFGRIGGRLFPGNLRLPLVS
jgi:hypothetical protein